GLPDRRRPPRRPALHARRPGRPGPRHRGTRPAARSARALRQSRRRSLPVPAGREALPARNGLHPRRQAPGRGGRAGRRQPADPPGHPCRRRPAQPRRGRPHLALSAPAAGACPGRGNLLPFPHVCSSRSVRSGTGGVVAFVLFLAEVLLFGVDGAPLILGPLTVLATPATASARRLRPNPTPGPAHCADDTSASASSSPWPPTCPANPDHGLPARPSRPRDRTGPCPPPSPPAGVSSPASRGLSPITRSRDERPP